MNMGTVFWDVLLIVGITNVFFIPVILSYTLYYYIKEMGEIFRKIGFAIFSITAFLTSISFIGILILVVLSIYDSPFGPKYEKIVLKQKIGGKLICSSVYTANHQDWEYRVNYYYVPNNNDTIPMGSGYFDTRSWGRDEQLGKYGDWLFLRTAEDKYMDKVILKNIVTDSTTSYQINISDKYNFERVKQHLEEVNDLNSEQTIK